MAEISGIIIDQIGQGLSKLHDQSNPSGKEPSNPSGPPENSPSRRGLLLGGLAIGAAAIGIVAIQRQITRSFYSLEDLMKQRTSLDGTAVVFDARVEPAGKTEYIHVGLGTHTPGNPSVNSIEVDSYIPNHVVTKDSFPDIIIADPKKMLSKLSQRGAPLRLEGRASYIESTDAVKVILSKVTELQLD